MQSAARNQLRLTDRPGWFLYRATSVEQTAIHEAAHAVFAEIAGTTVDEVSIHRAGRIRGYVKVRFEGPIPGVPGGTRMADKRNLSSNIWTEIDMQFRQSIRTLLAGPIAATRVSPGPTRWSNDLRKASCLAMGLLQTDWKDVLALIWAERAAVVTLMEQPEVWSAIAGLARELQFRGIVRAKPGLTFSEYRTSSTDWLISKAVVSPQLS